MSDTYYVVGIHGAPTPETAPHGVMWRSRHGDGSCSRWYYGEAPPNTLMAEWAPLPPPPTEQAQPPEPAKRWGVYSGTGNVSVLTYGGTRWLDYDQAKAAADALNALDRDGRMKGMGR